MIVKNQPRSLILISSLHVFFMSFSALSQDEYAAELSCFQKLNCRGESCPTKEADFILLPARDENKQPGIYAFKKGGAYFEKLPEKLRKSIDEHHLAEQRIRDINQAIIAIQRKLDALEKHIANEERTLSKKNADLKTLRQEQARHVENAKRDALRQRTEEGLVCKEELKLSEFETSSLRHRLDSKLYVSSLQKDQIKNLKKHVELSDELRLAEKKKKDLEDQLSTDTPLQLHISNTAPLHIAYNYLKRTTTVQKTMEGTASKSSVPTSITLTERQNEHANATLFNALLTKLQQVPKQHENASVVPALKSCLELPSKTLRALSRKQLCELNEKEFCQPTIETQDNSKATLTNQGRKSK